VKYIDNEIALIRNSQDHYITRHLLKLKLVPKDKLIQIKEYIDSKIIYCNSDERNVLKEIWDIIDGV